MNYTPELLQQVILQGYEDNHIDFKQEFNWNTFDIYRKAKLAKHLAALANTPDGGMLIFGVADSKQLLGLSQEDLESVDRTLIDQFISSYLDPLPHYSIITVEFHQHSLLIFEVDEFRDIPIICRQDYPDVLRAGGIYTRQNASSRLIQDSKTMRELIEIAVKKKKEELMKSFEEILDGESR